MDANAGLTLMTRIGFAARGILYVVIAILIIKMGRAEDPSGALKYVADGGGRMLLLAMTAGLVAYGLWRLADALFNVEMHQEGKKGLRERMGAGGSGVVHLLLAWQAARLLEGAPSADGSPQKHAQSALSLPGGEIVLIVAGVVLIGVGLFQIFKGFRGGYLRHLEPRMANETWVIWLGRVGYCARGLVFLISGFFVLRAGLGGQASKAGGMEEALAWLLPPWDVVVALGLLGFGLYCLVEARFRVLHGVRADFPLLGRSRA